MFTFVNVQLIDDLLLDMLVRNELFAVDTVVEIDHSQLDQFVYDFDAVSLRKSLRGIFLYNFILIKFVFVNYLEELSTNWMRWKSAARRFISSQELDDISLLESLF